MQARESRSTEIAIQRKEMHPMECLPDYALHFTILMPRLVNTAHMILLNVLTVESTIVRIAHSSFHLVMPLLQLQWWRISKLWAIHHTISLPNRSMNLPVSSLLSRGISFSISLTLSSAVTAPSSLIPSPTRLLSTLPG